jgi:hypothetical protein
LGAARVCNRPVCSSYYAIAVAIFTDELIRAKLYQTV